MESHGKGMEFNFRSFVGTLMNVLRRNIFTFSYKIRLLFQDKTFGMKNKKGGKQQKFIKMVEQQVKQTGPKPTRVSLSIYLFAFIGPL